MKSEKQKLANREYMRRVRNGGNQSAREKNRRQEMRRKEYLDDKSLDSGEHYYQMYKMDALK